MDIINNAIYLQNSICCACLSTDRKLVPAFKVATEILNYFDFDTQDLVCWECTALINKLIKFKKQVKNAKDTLKSLYQYNVQNKIVKSLTSLNFHTKIFYDTELNYDFKEKEEPPDFVEYNDYTENNECIDNKEFQNDYDENKYKREIKSEPRDVEIKTRKVRKFKFSKRESNKYVVLIMDEAQMLRARETDRLIKWYLSCNYKCDSCIVGYKNKELYDKHVSTKHSENIGKYICNICNVRFSNKKLMGEHCQSHYWTYKCRLCDTTHHQLKLLLSHYNKVHENRRYLCKYCGKEFRTFRTKRYHIEMMHKENPKCDECGRVFPNKTNLKRHHVIVHTANVPVLECPVCNKKYKGEWSLKSHMKFHSTNDVAEDAYCAECDMQFKNITLYKSHLKKNSRHISPEEENKFKKYACPECGKRFPQRVYLTRHIDGVHLKKKEHVCHICCKMYGKAYSLRQHIKFIHEGNNPPKNFICDICHKAFASKIVLKQHINSHTGERPYACKHCSATFGFASARYMHTKLIHLKQKRPDKGGYSGARTSDENTGVSYSGTLTGP